MSLHGWQHISFLSCQLTVDPVGSVQPYVRNHTLLHREPLLRSGMQSWKEIKHKTFQPKHTREGRGGAGRGGEGRDSFNSRLAASRDWV